MAGPGVLTISALAVLAYMTALFFAALLRRDNSIVDIGWGPGFILLAGLNLALRPEPAVRPLLVSTLVLVWGGRLSLHVFFRNRKRGEDFRYAAWRRRWGRWFVPRSYLQIFILQGAIMLVIASPLLILARAPNAPWSALDAVGLALWTGGFVFEASADAQLAGFKRRPENKGRIMAEGLWRFTRHPNYFGEAVMWWGIFLITLSVRGSWPAAISPLLMTFLLRFVSGVPLLERKYAGNRDFAAYAAKTNAFLPWFPRS